MDKIILKKIAKDIAKAVLRNVEFTDDEEDYLSREELNYIEVELNKIAERITSDKVETTIDAIIKKYYEF